MAELTDGQKKIIDEIVDLLNTENDGEKKPIKINENPEGIQVESLKKLKEHFISDAILSEHNKGDLKENIFDTIAQKKPNPEKKHSKNLYNYIHNSVNNGKLTVYIPNEDKEKFNESQIHDTKIINLLKIMGGNDTIDRSYLKKNVGTIKKIYEDNKKKIKDYLEDNGNSHFYLRIDLYTRFIFAMCDVFFNPDFNAYSKGGKRRKRRSGKKGKKTKKRVVGRKMKRKSRRRMRRKKRNTRKGRKGSRRR